MSKTVKADQLANEVAAALQTFVNSTDEALKAAVNNTAEQAAQIVKNGARTFGENYARDITVRKGRLSKRYGHTNIQAYVTAGDHYRVAHLLEHGHAIVAGGRVTGFWEGTPHFQKGQDYIDRNLVENLKKEIES